MKPAAIRYITLLGIFLLGSAATWSSLLEARGTSVPTSRIMQSARLFEGQGRLGKAAELYRRVLVANPRHVQARLSLERMTRNAQAVLGPSPQPIRKPVAEVTLVQAVEPGPQAKTLDKTAGPKAKLPEQPKPSFQKTRNALSQAGDKFKGLIPGFAVSQPKENADSDATGEAVVISGAAKVAQEEKARLAAKAAQEEKARLAAKAVQEEKARLAEKVAREEKARLAEKVAREEKARLAAKAVQEEKARLAAKAVQEEKARLAAKAVQEEKARLAAKSVQEKQQPVAPSPKEVAGSDDAGQVEISPVPEPRPKASETRRILGRVGKRIQEIVPEPAPKRPDFEEMGVVPPKPQIPEHLKRNGLSETSPSLRRPIQKLDDNGQPIAAAKPVPVPVETEAIQAVPENGVLPKTQKALAKAKERVGGLLPRIPERLQSPAVVLPVPETRGTPKVGAGQQFISKSRETWAKLRKGVASSKTKRPESNRTPLWKRLSDSLTEVKEKVSSRSVQKSEQVVVDETPVAPEIDSATARPTEVVRNGEIPPLTVSEQIEDAENKLRMNGGDAAGRAALIQVVNSAPDFEAALAAYTLGTRAKGHTDIMVALGQQLTLRGGVAKVHMAEALLRLDGNHVTATDALLKLTASENKKVRMMAAFSMQAATNVQKERCITALIKVLKDSDSDVRASAALALGGYGPSAKRAIPAIVTVIHDVDPGTARAAGVALQCVAGKSLDSGEIRPVAAEEIDGK